MSDELPLARVGVLELVDHHVRKLVAKLAAAFCGGVFDERQSELDLVGEVDHVALAFLLGVRLVGDESESSECLDEGEAVGVDGHRRPDEMLFWFEYLDDGRQGVVEPRLLVFGAAPPPLRACVTGIPFAFAGGEVVTDGDEPVARLRGQFPVCE